MESARVRDGGALPPPFREVIIISDDESESSGEASSSPSLEPFSWTEVADRLLFLAKNRTLRDDQEVVATLLNDLGIPPSIDIRRSLQATCEKLGVLLVFLMGHDRRYQACEDLVLVVCEVLSLVQTAPYKLRARREPWIKEEKEEEIHVAEISCVMDRSYQLMDRWGSLLAQCARSPESRSFTIGVTMSRLEALCAKCSSDIGRLQSSMWEYEQEMESATQEWAETMKKCRRDVESEGLEAEERDWKVFDDTFNMTDAVQVKFQDNNKARQSLVHHAKEKVLRRNFYRASLTLVCAVTQLTTAHAQPMQQLQMMSEEQVNVLGNDILVYMDTFCGDLWDVMALSSQCHGDSAGRTGSAREMAAARTAEQVGRSELVNFAKHIEAFWIIHRNWLPPGVLDLVTRSLGTLAGAKAQETTSELNRPTGCPVSRAVSRVCVGLQANCSM